MKYLLIITLISTATLFISCSEEQNPVLDITVTTLPSVKWDQLDIDISSINFFDEKDGTIGVSNLQLWNGADLTIDLDAKQSFLIANDDHWSQDLVGMTLDLGNVRLLIDDSLSAQVDVPYIDYVPLAERVLLENEKQYEIEFIFDLDELISEVNGRLIMEPNYTIEVREL